MIPTIHGIEERSGEKVRLPKDRIWFEGPAAMFAVFEERLRKVPGYERVRLVESEECVLQEKTDGKDAAAVGITAVTDPKEPKSGYLMKIGKSRIEITAGKESEIAHGLTTLFWQACETEGELSCGNIEDRPLYESRGFLLDSSRHFFDAAAVKTMIEQGALRKLNRLHWHLSDDQGYRIESRRFPKLNTVGSWRRELDGTVYGGYYTWEQIREVQDYAAARGVEVVPEIDLPGHVSAMLAAYPELSCSGEPMEAPAAPGIYGRILCVGRDEVIDFVKELLDEVCPLFDSPYFHIGGDEVPKGEWKTCPRCQERIRHKGLDGEEALQRWFTEELLIYLEKKGKTGVCWNETLKSGRLSERAVIQYWDEEGKGENYCERAFENGRKCIYSFTPYLYLDYIPALTPLRKVFFDQPLLRGGRMVPPESIAGCEATLWAEQIGDINRLEYMAFPRLFAVAQRAWSGRTSYEDFRKDCQKELAQLDRDGISHMTMEEADPEGEAQKRSVVLQYRQIIKNAERDGFANAQDVLCGLVRSKLTGQFAQEEIDDVVRQIKA